MKNCRVIVVVIVLLAPLGPFFFIIFFFNASFTLLGDLQTSSTYRLAPKFIPSYLFPPSANNYTWPVSLPCWGYSLWIYERTRSCRQHEIQQYTILHLYRCTSFPIRTRILWNRSKPVISSGIPGPWYAIGNQHRVRIADVSSWVVKNSHHGLNSVVIPADFREIMLKKFLRNSNTF